MNMATSVVDNLVKQALLTFCKASVLPSSNLEENLSKLKLLANKIKASDVYFDHALLEIRPTVKNIRQPPVTYIEIFEDSTITVGIFVVRKDGRLPLHDHPQMHGILKVIAGTIKIQSYTTVSTERESVESPHTKLGEQKPCTILARKLPESIVTEKSEACVLTPSYANIHEIHSVNGSAAFLDVLAPPYDSEIRNCHYYIEEIEHSDRSDSEGQPLARLVEIDSPPDYWCDSAPFGGRRYEASEQNLC